jgi:hypothetical protein
LDWFSFADSLFRLFWFADLVFVLLSLFFVELGGSGAAVVSAFAHLAQLKLEGLADELEAGEEFLHHDVVQVVLH